MGAASLHFKIAANVLFRVYFSSGIGTLRGRMNKPSVTNVDILGRSLIGTGADMRTISTARLCSMALILACLAMGSLLNTMAPSRCLGLSFLLEKEAGV